VASSNARAGIDFAAEAGLDYVIVDGQENDIPGTVAYAKQKKVGVWLSVDWRWVESEMEEAFPRFEAWGVRGLRIDGMKRDDQSMVEFYRKAASKAADHRMMLDFRGAYKPDGMQRTFPNVIAVEAVLGSEYAKVGARATPEHNVMLAYTRMLAGPMDYAPGGFRNVSREQFQPGQTLGTRAHQLALFVVFESGLQTLADEPAAYRGERDFEFIKNVPATWDETRAVGGEVGEYVSIARKRGNDWFLGAITDWTARAIVVPLAFLGEGSFEAELYTDAGRETRTVRATDTLRLELASGGGAAVHFKPRSTSR
jgi:alpha-glucosidase